MFFLVLQFWSPVYVETLDWPQNGRITTIALFNETYAYKSNAKGLNIKAYQIILSVFSDVRLYVCITLKLYNSSVCKVLINTMSLSTFAYFTFRVSSMFHSFFSKFLSTLHNLPIFSVRWRIWIFHFVFL